MKHYKIIYNKERLLSFIESLPDLEENEKFYCSLFARKKYSPELVKSNDRTQLKRFLTTKDRLYTKLTQLELPYGTWKIRDIVAPQESLVAYIHPNPRCMKKATFLLMKKCISLLETSAKGYNLQAESLSAVQQSVSRRIYVDFDIDEEPSTNLREFLLDLFEDNNCFRILVTRGGYHVLIEPKKISPTVKDNWYKIIKDQFKIDNVGDQMIPIPGCTQGGFVPKFI